MAYFFFIKFRIEPASADYLFFIIIDLGISPVNFFTGQFTGQATKCTGVSQAYSFIRPSG